jgi:hypothetical protein
MKKIFLGSLALSSFICASEYGFSMDELESIETKPYEYSGYIKGDIKQQNLKNDDSINIYGAEAFLNFQYFKGDYSFYFDGLSTYEKKDEVSNDESNINQLYLNFKYNDNHQVYGGKKTPKWGKGYYANPIAFLDKKKDPNDPEASREGYTQLNYKYNKVYKGDVQNITLDVIYLQTSKDINKELYSGDSNIVAFKSYFLYKDIDIDIAYVYSDKDTNKYGIDFSTNLETNFEIHGEYTEFDNGYSSYLLGLKYLTEKDLTILSEYFFQNETQDITTSLWNKKYFINSLTQKEPFEILYYSVYFKNMYNIDDKSMQNKLGVLYTGVTNLDMDLSYTKNSGDDTSEFGSKMAEDLYWVSLKYSF